MAETTWIRSLGEVQATVSASTAIRVAGRGTSLPWRAWMALPKQNVPHFDEPWVNLRFLRDLVDFSPADQVVTVQAGRRILELQKILREKNQCLPIGLCGSRNLGGSSLGGAIALNLPHTLEGTYGTWRDWILGMKVVLADGTLVKCGSHAVKNVAGYDLQKLFVGSRGTLGIIVEVTLRTFPLAVLPPAPIAVDEPKEPKIVVRKRWRGPVIQRVLLSDVDEACCDKEELVVDKSTGTLWYRILPDEEPRRFPGDWLLRGYCGERNLQFTNPTQIRLMKRAKEIFDPTYKLNPGEMGTF